MLEKDIEAKAVATARAEGWFSRKFSSPANRGVPDRLFIKDGVTVFIEFKREGKHATPLQQRELDQLCAAGVTARVAHSVGEAMAILCAAHASTGARKLLLMEYAELRSAVEAFVATYREMCKAGRAGCGTDADAKLLVKHLVRMLSALGASHTIPR